MKAWVYRKHKSDAQGIHIFQEELPVPQVGPSQVLIKVQKVSVCGTDESLFKGELRKVPDGIVPGHEFYGEIAELGKDVRGFTIGQRIAGESHYQVDAISDQGIIGLWGPEIRKGEMLPPLHGAYAQYLVIPSECAHPVPDQLVSDHFWPSLFEAIGNDYFLIRRTKTAERIRNLGLFGCGPHGLFAQVFARHFEIARIAAFETDTFRRDFAAGLNIADAVFDPAQDLIPKVQQFTSGEMFDVTIDLVGKTGKAFESCCRTTRDGGSIFLFGLFSDRFSINGIPGNEIIFKMKTVDYEFEGKRLHVEGITGREGIWEELIDVVCNSERLQEQLMKPVHVMGTLEHLGEHTRAPQKNILKRAYHPFHN